MKHDHEQNDGHLDECKPTGRTEPMHVLQQTERQTEGQCKDQHDERPREDDMANRRRGNVGHERAEDMGDGVANDDEKRGHTAKRKGKLEKSTGNATAVAVADLDNVAVGLLPACEFRVDGD